MSYKTISLIVLILILGAFLAIKYETNGDPNSHFNQTTRFTMAGHPVMRALFGLHNKGDARAEYLGGSTPLVVEWFEPVSENVNSAVVQQFADLAGKYTGRPDQAIFGGNVSEGTVSLDALNNLALKAAPPYGSSVLYVVFATDYQPRDTGELSTTHGETTMVISLNANRQFLASFTQDLSNYLLADMLHEFGTEIGLPEQGTDSSCIMNPHAGMNGLPLESYDRLEPQDFCQAEQQQITQLKLQY